MEQETASPTTAGPLDVPFGGFERLTVRQRRRWREREFKTNNYDVHDHDQRLVLRVDEQPAPGLWNALAGKILGSQRGFSLAVVEQPSQRPLLHLHRPLALGNRMVVTTADGQPVGQIRMQWAVHRRYRIEDARGALLAELHSRRFSETFRVMVGGEERGLIARRSTPFLQELFKSEGDRFGVDLTRLVDPRLKALTLAATLLVDAATFRFFDEG